MFVCVCVWGGGGLPVVMDACLMRIVRVFPWVVFGVGSWKMSDVGAVCVACCRVRCRRCSAS